MKYTAKIKQAQYAGGIKINPQGGELKEDQVKQITTDPYGKDLIRKGYLVIEGVKPEDVDKPAKPAAKKNTSENTGAPKAAGNTEPAKAG